MSRSSRYLEVELKASIRSYRFSFVRDFMKSPYIQIQLISVGVERSDGTPTGTSRLNRYQKHTDVIIMDFAKAFYKVPHRGLLTLYKLEYYGIRGSTHKWISSWLSERSQKVVLDGQASDPAPVLSGVPKGRSYFSFL